PVSASYPRKTESRLCCGIRISRRVLSFYRFPSAVSLCLNFSTDRKTPYFHRQSTCRTRQSPAPYNRYDPALYALASVHSAQTLHLLLNLPCRACSGCTSFYLNRSDRLNQVFPLFLLLNLYF